MKKALSLFLALVMALSVCAAVPAYAETYDYECYAIPHGKKGGDIAGYFVNNIRRAESVDGCEEVVALEQRAFEKSRETQDKLREVVAAVAEVEKDKTELEIILFELKEDWFCWAEGFGGSIGDPSACARNIDVFIADMSAATDDAETAHERGNRKTAYRALLELWDAAETYYDGFIPSVGDIDLLCDYLKDAEAVYERAYKLRAKAEADVEKANALIDEAKELFNSMLSYLAAAREKATELNHPELAADIDHDDELTDDFHFSEWKHEAFDFDALDAAVKEGRERNLAGYFDERVKDFPDIFSEFFVTANDLTYNGQNQQLVIPGRIVPEGEGDTLYALGNKPVNMYPIFDWSVDVDASELPEEAAFGTEIPAAKDPGTYYVYCKFPGGDVFAQAVTIKEAPKPAPEPVKPVKKANPLYAKGKTVKVKRNKKTVIKKSKAFTVKDAQGAVTFKKSKGNRKITVAKNGKITVKKGLKKGTYKVKIKVTAAGNADYNAAVKTVTVKIKVS